MAMTDPIADMLTRIRNANKERHASLTFPASTKKVEILNILKKEGYIADFSVEKLENNKCEISTQILGDIISVGSEKGIYEDNFNYFLTLSNV